VWLRLVRSSLAWGARSGAGACDHPIGWGPGVTYSRQRAALCLRRVFAHLTQKKAIGDAQRSLSAPRRRPPPAPDSGPEQGGIRKRRPTSRPQKPPPRAPAAGEVHGPDAAAHGPARPMLDGPPHLPGGKIRLFLRDVANSRRNLIGLTTEWGTPPQSGCSSALVPGITTLKIQLRAGTGPANLQGRAAAGSGSGLRAKRRRRQQGSRPAVEDGIKQTALLRGG